MITGVFACLISNMQLTLPGISTQSRSITHHFSYKKHIYHAGNNCGEKGDVLIYNIDGDPDAHAAVALGGCRLDQHNPSRCGTAANWGPNKVLSKR